MIIAYQMYDNFLKMLMKLYVHLFDFLFCVCLFCLFFSFVGTSSGLNTWLW